MMVTPWILPLSIRDVFQMRYLPNRLICLFGMAWLVVAGQALSADELSPEAAKQVTETYYAALGQQGFAGVVDLLHPQEIERFRSMVMPGFERERAAGRRTLINATFGRNADLTQVRLADSADFVRRFARLASARSRDLPVGYDQVVVLGSVEEGDMLLMVSRIETGRGADASQRLEVLSLKPYNGQWRVMLDSRFEEMARSLGGGRGQQSRQPPRVLPVPEVEPEQEPAR